MSAPARPAGGPPSAHALRLAERFRALNQAAIHVLEDLSEMEWRSTCIREPRTVAVVSHHMAAAHTIIGGAIAALADGRPAPDGIADRTPEDGVVLNARHAAEQAQASRSEVLTLLRRDGECWARFIESLDDERLTRSGRGWGIEAKVYQFIQGGLIGHLREHLDTIREAAGSLRGTPPG